MFRGGPCLPLYIRGDRVTWKVLAKYRRNPTTTQSGSFLCTAIRSMPIHVVTREVRYIHQLSLTLEHSMPISSPAAPGLTYTLPKMLLNSSRNKTRCPHFIAPGRGPPQQSYLKQVVAPEDITDNNSWSIKIKETKRINKSQVSIAPGVANHRQIKLHGLSQAATTTTAGTTGRK